MLSELYIKNYALIETTKISFSLGLNVFTGETGAGKSLIMDCISLVIGGRASSEMVRTGCESTLIEAVFEDVNFESVAQIIRENELEVDLNEEIILSREIFVTGKSRARVNGKLVPLQILTSIGEALLNIYGQHEHQILSRPSQHLKILDDFGGTEISDVFLRYAESYSKWREVVDKISQIDADRLERTRKLDILRHQLEEIESYDLQPGEDVRLLEERSILSNFDKINFELKRAYMLLADVDNLESRTVQDILSEAGSAISSVSSCAQELEEVHQLVSEASSLIDDAVMLTRKYLDSFEFDAERLNFVEERLDNISKLKRKYGEDIAEILNFASQCREEISLIENTDKSSTELSEKLEVLKRDTSSLAEELSVAREKAGASLEKEVSAQLRDLGMVNAGIVVKKEDATSGFELHYDEKNILVNTKGKDSVELLFSANLGEPLKPLAKVASGGELSRIMLAMKSALSSSDEISTMIFDEVDQGVGGRAANAVADKLVAISQDKQTIVVTHLPQVASRAKKHFRVDKSVFLDRTNVDVTILSKEERIEEIARMIGGKEVTKLTYDAAKEILELANDN